MADYVTLPSGNRIDVETWEAMRASGGDWRGWLDARMYPEVDRDFMDRELPHNEQEED